jgi:hypothetical protein
VCAEHQYSYSHSTAAAALKRRFTSEQDEEIELLYKSGKTLLAIAERYGASTAAVAGALDRRGIKRRHLTGIRSTPLTRSQELEIVSRFLAGERINALADEFHIGSKRCYAIVEQEGHKPKRGPRRGPDHPHWKGGRGRANTAGYIARWVPADHPYASMRNHKGRVPEHRLVVAEAIGRPLRKEETVHHINGVKHDNRLENLQLMSRNHGPRIMRRCGVCGSHVIETVALP